MDFDKVSDVLKAIAHPIRLKILAGLSEASECNVNKIVQILKIPQSTASQHLGILRTRGVISQRKEGVKVCYSIKDPKITEILSIFNKN